MIYSIQAECCSLATGQREKNLECPQMEADTIMFYIYTKLWEKGELELLSLMQQIRILLSWLPMLLTKFKVFWVDACLCQFHWQLILIGLQFIIYFIIWCLHKHSIYDIIGKSLYLTVKSYVLQKWQRWSSHYMSIQALMQVSGLFWAWKDIYLAQGEEKSTEDNIITARWVESNFISDACNFIFTASFV